MYPKGHAPGIYFNMPEDEYHADPALSCSGIKLLLDDPEEFWFKTKHLNDNAPEQESSKAADRGTMWHHKLLTPETFDDVYAKGFDPQDFPDAKYICDTVDELKSALLLESVEFKPSWGAQKLLEVCPDTIIYSKDKSILKADGKEVVKADDWHDMCQAMSNIRSNEKFSSVFENGYPEVSIFWVDEDTGVPCRSRIDWLKAGVLLDYKTMSLSRGKKFDDVCRNKLRFESYDLQAVMYTIGRRAVAKVIEDSWDSETNNFNAVHGNVSDEFIKNLLSEKDPLFGFVFQRTEAPFSIRGIHLKESIYETSPWGQGLMKFCEGIESYRKHFEKFGKDRWVDSRGIVAVEDHEVYYP